MTRPLREIFEEIKQQKAENVINVHTPKEKRKKADAEEPTIIHIKNSTLPNKWVVGFYIVVFLLAILGIENAGNYWDGLYDSPEYVKWALRSK